MNEEFESIFNGDEVVGSNGESAAQMVDGGVMQAFYNEVEPTILQSQDSNPLIVDDSQSSISGENFNSFKALEAESSKIGDPNDRTADMACASVTVKDDSGHTAEFPTVQQTCELPIENANQGTVDLQLDSNAHHHNSNAVDDVDFSDNCKFDMSVHDVIGSVSEPILLQGVPKDADCKPKEDPVNNCNSGTKDDQGLLPIVNGSEPNLKDQVIMSLCGTNGTEATVTENQIHLTEIPDNWKITILEENGSVSHSAEPLIASEQGAYQLWECPKCTALFREKDICESHVSNAHVFTCGMCWEPCESREALESHIVQHISEALLVAPSLPSTPNKRNAEKGGIDVVPPSKKQKLNSQDKTSIKETPELKNIVTSSDEDDDSKVKQETASAESDSQLNEFEIESQFCCPTCGKECYTHESLQVHQQRSHRRTAQNMFKCSICSAMFATQSSLQNHAMKHIKKPASKALRCNVCHTNFEKTPDLKQHVQVHADFPYACEFCGLRYKVGVALLNHIKVHHPNGKEHRCPECEKSFKIKLHLEVHMSEVHASERKKCKYCSRTYKSQEQLLNHVQDIHDREESKHFDCDYCSMTFNTERKLRKHNEVHLATIQSYDCSHCSSTFPTSQELKIHIQTHFQSSGIYHCDWCSRSFDFKKNLDVHVKIHHSPMYRKMDLED